MTSKQDKPMNCNTGSKQAFNAVTALTFIACFMAGSVNAADDYRCTIEKRINASPEPPAIQKVYESAYVGKQFTVERKTGIMAGALLNAFTNDPEIIDEGSNEKAYKVVSTIKPEEEHLYGSNIYALVVNESEKTAQKPFVFMENGVVYLGKCEHVMPGR